MSEKELKIELLRQAESISVEGVVTEDALDRLSVVLSALRDLKSALQNKVSVPEHFLCPISSEIMKEPVVLATGETYDRPFIQAWLNAGNRTCPKTQQVLLHCFLTPNHSLSRMISDWCESNGVDLPVRDNTLTSASANANTERIKLSSLLEKISLPSVSERKKAAKELRLLTKKQPSFRTLIGDYPDAIPQLLSLLSSPDLRHHPQMQEDIVTTILNISIHDNNKKLVGENPLAIPLLVNALATGNMETRSNAAAALFTLSALDSNKLRIGESGAFSPLIKLFEEGSPMAKKDASSAIFNLCLAAENRSRAVKEGAVGVLVRTVAEQTLVDESLSILAMLSGNQEAAFEVSSNGGVPALLGIIKTSDCSRNRENSAVILHSVCLNDRTKLREIREEEELNGTISQLGMSGTSRARRKAAGILERINRTKGVAHSV